MNELIVEKRYTDGSYEKHNLTQRLKVMRAKGILIPEDVYYIHPIMDKKFKFHDQIVTFTKVRKCWEAGYYYVGTFVNQNKFEAMVCIDIGNCIDENLHKSFEKFQTDFKPI